LCLYIDYPVLSKEIINKRRHPMDFEVGDHVYLQVSLMKGVHHFGILEKYGPLAYRAELPPRLSGIHNVFHISQLKRCLKPPTDVVVEDTIPLELNLTYKSYLIKILEQQDRATQKKAIQFYKV
jgi:hypothetical protein